MDKDVLRVFFFKQKTAYEVRISDWSSDVCSSELEGIGQGRITANLEGITPDDAFQIPDEEALPVVYDLVQHEGLVLGGSSGINVAAAIRLAKQMGHGHTIVTILCDEIGRASCRERVCQDGELSVGAVSLKKKKKTQR